MEVAAAFGVLRCFDDDLLTEQVRAFGAHTRPELAFLSSVLEQGDRVLDLGAHIGSYAIPLGQRVAPTGTVVAVEADRAYFSLLSANVVANGLDATVKPVNAIVAPLGASYRAAHHTGNTGATRFVRRRIWQRPSEVQVLGIDDLAAEHGAPIAVKIDIEGLELTVLESSRLIREKRPILCAEVCAAQLHRYSRTVQEFSDFLRGLGYRLFRNIGERNAPHDRFRAVELPELPDGNEWLYDVLAVPNDSSRLCRVAVDQ